MKPIEATCVCATAPGLSSGGHCCSIKAKEGTPDSPGLYLRKDIEVLCGILARDSVQMPVF